MVDEFLRVKGAKDVWAIGDVSDVESWQFITVIDRVRIWRRT